MAKYVPLPIHGKLTQAFTKAVTDYLLVETSLRKADLIFVFGNHSRTPLAQQAAKLYKKGFAKKIVVSGGVYGDHPLKEADDIAQQLIKAGIPKEDILIEDKAQNTGENVIYSKQLVEEKIGLDKVSSVIAIGNIIAARRFLMTLERHWPGLDLVSAPVNMHDVPKEKWYTVEKFKQQVLTEYKKIPDYFRQGFLAEVKLKFVK